MSLTDADLDALEAMLREKLTTCAMCADVATVRCKDCKTILCDVCSTPSASEATCAHGVEPIVQRWSIALRALKELRELRAKAKSPTLDVGDVIRHPGGLLGMIERKDDDILLVRLHDWSFVRVTQAQTEDARWTRIARGQTTRSFNQLRCPCNACVKSHGIT